jgi:hypothetical protein
MAPGSPLLRPLLPLPWRPASSRSAVTAALPFVAAVLLLFAVVWSQDGAAIVPAGGLWAASQAAPHTAPLRFVLRPLRPPAPSGGRTSPSAPLTRLAAGPRPIVNGPADAAPRTPPINRPLCLAAAVCGAGLLLRLLQRAEVPSPPTRWLGLWATSGEKVRVGAMVVWPNPSNPTELNVGRVVAEGLEVAGQRHWNVLEFQPVAPKTYAPGDGRPRPVMAKRLRAVPYEAAAAEGEGEEKESDGRVRIDADQMFARRTANPLGGAPSADATNLMVEYETRKKELWQEGVASSVFLGLLVLVNYDLGPAFSYTVGALGGLSYFALLMLYTDSLRKDPQRTNLSRLRFLTPFLVGLILAIAARASEGVTLAQAIASISEDPLNLFRLIHITQNDCLSAITGFLAHRIPFVVMAVRELGDAVFAEVSAGRTRGTFSDRLRDRYNPRRRRKEPKP